MVEGAPLPSRISLFAALFVFAAGGCARSAPELPPDYGSVDAPKRLSIGDFSKADMKMSCPDLDREFALLSKKMEALDHQIRSKHGSNQAAGYIAGVLFPPALLAMESSSEQKQALDQHQDRSDTLLALKRVKNCAS